MNNTLSYLSTLHSAKNSSNLNLLGSNGASGTLNSTNTTSSSITNANPDTKVRKKLISRTCMLRKRLYQVYGTMTSPLLYESSHVPLLRSIIEVFADVSGLTENVDMTSFGRSNGSITSDVSTIDDDYNRRTTDQDFNASTVFLSFIILINYNNFTEKLYSL